MKLSAKKLFFAEFLSNGGFVKDFGFVGIFNFLFFFENILTAV